MHNEVYLGLGSNQDNPREQVLQAHRELDDIPGSRLDKCSSLYQSSPMGPIEQDDFINSVVRVITSLSPLDLLQATRAIEAKHKRHRDLRWGPRTLDIDILLYGPHFIDTPELSIPHKGLYERNFVLEPLFEIAPDLMLPDERSLKQVLKEFQSSIVVNRICK